MPPFVHKSAQGHVRTREAEAMSVGKFVVRAMADREEAAVIALWEACGLTRPWNDPETDLAFARSKRSSDVLVGLVDGRIVASAMVGHDGHRGAMYYVSVHPDWRDRGLGAELVAAAEAWLRARGVWKVNLLVRAGNEQVLGFYGAQGYVTGTSVPIEKWIDPSKRGGKG